MPHIDISGRCYFMVFGLTKPLCEVSTLLARCVIVLHRDFYDLRQSPLVRISTLGCRKWSQDRGGGAEQAAVENGARGDLSRRW